MLALLPRPAILAHRGASAYAPENTLAAFELASRQRADGLELDAKLSADGQVVVIHDQSVDRTTDGHGRVGQMDFEALRRLDAGSWYDSSFRGQKIPALEEVLERVGGQLLVNVELTNYASPFDDLPRKVADLLKRGAHENNVLVSSFNPVALLKCFRLLPLVPLGLLVFAGQRGAWARLLFTALVPHGTLHPHYRDATPNLIARVHRKGRRVFAYTVNQISDMQALFRSGVDGIFTDDPLRAQGVRAEVFP